MTATRREFLKRSAAAGAVASAPLIWKRSLAWGEDVNDKLTVASIGVGGSRGRYSQGGAIGRRAAALGHTIAVCDVDDVHTAEYNAAHKEKYGYELNMYGDYRELFDKEQPDIVTIGTPDHWHVPIAITALRAGSDVYCEKPLTLTIDEGKAIRRVVEETGRVFQVGTQQRSENNSQFLKAIAMVQSGRLGKNVNAYVAIGGAPNEGPFDAMPVPEGLNWDFWLGPTASVDYCEQRRRMFRWWFEYSGGKMTDWGAHHIDIALWALGYDHSGPVKAHGTCTFPSSVSDSTDWYKVLNGESSLPNGYNTAVTFNIDLDFDNGAVLNVNDEYKREGTNIAFDNGILFEGDEGRIFVNRGKLEGKPIDDLTDADNDELHDRIIKLYKGREPGNHMQNFFDCVKDREQPISDVVTHHRTMTCCHLCNLTLMLGRPLNWDPKAETFLGDDEAMTLMSRRRRDEYDVKM